jgi:hypothetical protein
VNDSLVISITYILLTPTLLPYFVIVFSQSVFTILLIHHAFFFFLSIYLRD